MTDYAPPSGPPPPKVPEGWKAIWNDQYKEWFYVNTHTKQSQWDRPTEAIYPGSAGGSDDAPPRYGDAGNPQNSGPEKGAGSLAPGSSSSRPTSSQMTDDEQLARKLQQEENRKSASRGEADSYYAQGPGGPSATSPSNSYGQQGQGSYGANELPPRPADQGKRGLLGKLLGKTSSSQQPQQGYPQQGYPQQQPMYAQQHGGYYPPQGYPPQQQMMYAQQPGRRPGGMGMAGGAALGLGGGLLGGMMLGEALGGHDGGGFGGDDGGGDMGGGDMGGGDMGGGDMGGGDF